MNFQRSILYNSTALTPIAVTAQAGDDALAGLIVWNGGVVINLDGSTWAQSFNANAYQPNVVTAVSAGAAAIWIPLNFRLVENQKIYVAPSIAGSMVWILQLSIHLIDPG